jgi:hypothetical protein
MQKHGRLEEQLTTFLASSPQLAARAGALAVELRQYLTNLPRPNSASVSVPGFFFVPMAGWACRSVVRLQAKITGDVRTPLRQPVPIGDMHREGFLEHCQQSLGNCGVVVVTLQVGDDLTLTIDVPLPTLNAAFRFLDVSLQEVRFMGHLTGHRWNVGHFLLDRRLSDRSPLRRARHDNKNNHSAETEAGLRLMESLLELILKATRKSPWTFPAKPADVSTVHRRSWQAKGPRPRHGLGPRLKQPEVPLHRC